MPKKMKSQYDYMREAASKEEDAAFPEEWAEEREKTDKENCAYLNAGIVIKNNANQYYTTSAISGAIFKNLCQKANVPYQTFANRSDMRGGSTLGNISNRQVSLHSVDIGIAQLAMHSSYECAGVKDSDYMLEAITLYYNSDIVINGSDEFIIK